MIENMHVSRLWHGGDKARFEEECICAEAPCSFVIPDNDCPQHGFRFAKTIRNAHMSYNCPEEDQK